MGAQYLAEKNKEDFLHHRIYELENAVMKEKEKSLSNELKVKQQQEVSGRLEVSLKDMRERIAKDLYAKEINQERVSLKKKLKELEKKLTEERQVWMQIMQTQVKKENPTDKEKITKFLELLETDVAKRLKFSHEVKKDTETALSQDKTVSETTLPKSETTGNLKEKLVAKNVLSKELSGLNQVLTSLESQGKYVNKAAAVISELKHTINSLDTDKLKTSADTVSTIRQKLSEAEKQRQTETQNYVNIAKKARQDKLRAISELLTVKENLNRFKAVSVALGRELHIEKGKNRKISLQVNLQATEISKLKATLCLLKRNYDHKLDIFKKLSYERNLKAEHFKKELSVLQEEHSKKKSEFESILKIQSERYSSELNKLINVKHEAELNLEKIQTEKTGLQRRYGILLEKTAQINNTNKKLCFEKSALLQDKSILKKELEKVSSAKYQTQNNVIVLTKQTETLIRQKENLEQMLLDLKDKFSKNSSLFSDMRNKISHLQSDNQTLSERLDKKESQLTAALAKNNIKTQEFEGLKKALEDEIENTVGLNKQLSGQKENLKKELARIAELKTKLEKEKKDIYGEAEKNAELAVKKLETQKNEILTEIEQKSRVEEERLIRRQAEISGQKLSMQIETEKANKSRMFFELHKSLMKEEIKRAVTERQKFEQSRKEFEHRLNQIEEANFILNNRVKKEQFGRAELKLKLRQLEQKNTQPLQKKLKWPLKTVFSKEKTLCPK